MDRKSMKRVIVLLLVFLANTGTGFGQAHNWAFGPFKRPAEVNPIITPDEHATFYCPMRNRRVRWEAMATFNPAAVVKNDTVYVLYRAEDKLGTMQIGGHTSRIGMAVSGDGLHFSRKSKPVLYPENDDQKMYEWPGGCEDPRVVETGDGRYVMAYTQWNHKIPRLSIATSKDLKNWDKHGPAFIDAYDGKYTRSETKSGAILTRRKGDHLVAVKIDGKYWMYWGVPRIHLATSSDLIHWKPVEDKQGKLKNVLSPRPGYFDSWLVEAGPPALLTDDGILLMYNAGNSADNGDPDLPDSVYVGGQALYDARQPDKLLQRLDRPFIQPEEDFEKSGQYRSGTTFLEGLVHFQKQWFIYYGTADSRVGVVAWTPVE